MLTFQLEKPFSKQEIEKAVGEEKSNISLVNSRMRNIGIFVILAILGYGIFNKLGQKPTDVYPIILLIFPMAFGCICLLHPFLGTTNIGLKKYLTDPQKNHYCQAFIGMPGMEKHKNYVEKVTLEGRNLTNFECDEIIKHYESLLK